MHDLDPHAERAAVIAAIARTHREAGGLVDLSPAAKAARRPLYARLDEISAGARGGDETRSQRRRVTRDINRAYTAVVSGWAQHTLVPEQE